VSALANEIENQNVTLEDANLEDDSVQIQSTESIAAYLLSDGSLVDVKKSAASKKERSSNKIDPDEDDFGEMYSSGRVYRPTLRLTNLKVFSTENIYHERCIRQKAIDACKGWDIVTVDRKGVAVKTEEQKKASTKENKLYDFFDSCTLFEDFSFLAGQIAIDFETFGYALVEMTRTKNGQPARFYHMAPETCRLARDLRDVVGETDQRYIVQIVNTHERIFKIYDGEAPKITEPHTGTKMTEALFIRRYHVDGGKYGIPGWVPSLKAMVGNDKVAEYNINFFNNEAVPRFAVVVSGGKLDDDTKTFLNRYFKKELKGVANAHKTLVLSAPKGTEIKLIPLAVEMKDGGFRYYRKDNRDEVIAAHGVPPHRIQVYDIGDSGTISPGSLFNIDKNYKYSIIEPLQCTIANMFNKIIKLDFGIKDKQLQFNPLDIGEEENQANIKKTIAAAHEKYYNMGAMNIDEIRAELKLQKFGDMTDIDDEIKEWSKTPKPVYLIRQAMLTNPGDGIGSNVAGQGVNETPNDFNDKSKEATGQSGKVFNDNQMNQLMMKSSVGANFALVYESLGQIQKSVEDLANKIEDGEK
jgi:PBSX family phage portal protein